MVCVVITFVNIVKYSNPYLSRIKLFYKNSETRYHTLQQLGFPHFVSVAKYPILQQLGSTWVRLGIT
jgi:hypothetical protein